MTIQLRHCGACGAALVRQRRDARYCDDACRLRAHRGIKVVNAVPARHSARPVRAELSVSGTPTPSAVTSSPSGVDETDNVPILRASKPPIRKLDRRIVPDPVWPGMYRIRKRDGSLTDMVNLTRAKDALCS